MLDRSRHVCAFFNSKEEEYRVLLPFVTRWVATSNEWVEGSIYWVATSNKWAEESTHWVAISNKWAEEPTH